jgi:hypothetical protein
MLHNGQMSVQVVRILRDDNSVRIVRLRDDARPDQDVIIEPDSWERFLERVKAGEFDHPRTIKLGSL